jgi:hypothetical protein
MDKRGVVVGWVSSSREPSSRKTIEQCVRRTANSYSTPDRNDQEAYMRSRGIMDAKRGVLINILGVGASLLPGGMATSRPTDERRNGLRPARANTDTGLRRFGPLLPGIRSKDQTDLLTLVRGPLAMELFADSSALCDHSRGWCVLILVGIRHKTQLCTVCDPGHQNRIVPPPPPQSAVFTVRPTR